MATLPFVGSQICFTVYGKPVPQGSAKGFVIPGKNGMGPRAIVTSANKNLKPYRQEFTHAAMHAVGDSQLRVGPWAAKHVPVSVVLDFYLQKPESISKKRTHMVVKPDCDKLIRGALDAMTGSVFADDAQVVELNARKHYGTPERVEVSVAIL